MLGEIIRGPDCSSTDPGGWLEGPYRVENRPAVPMLAPWIAMASPAPRSNRTQMGRTYVLAVLVLICAAYLFRTKHGRPRSGLEAAKEKIENISKQPTAHDDRTAFFAATP